MFNFQNDWLNLALDLIAAAILVAAPIWISHWFFDAGPALFDALDQLIDRGF